MKRIPVATKICHAAVEIYDDSGIFMHRVSFGTDQVANAAITGNTLTVNLANGRLKAFTIGHGHSPILRFTR